MQESSGRPRVQADLRPREGASAGSVIERAVEAARSMLDMDMAYVAQVDDGLHVVRCTSGGSISDTVAGTAGASCCLALLQRRIGTIVTDTAAHPVLGALPEVEGLGSFIGVPLVLSGGETYGTLCCLGHAARPDLDERDVRFLQALADMIAASIEHERRQRRGARREVTASGVCALIAALDARDGDTGDHSTEVAQLAVGTGRTIGLGDEELAEVEHAAWLHDIGKIGISDAVLRKRGPLSADEWAEVRRHTEIGERIVSRTGGLAHLAPIVRATHEHFDGSGYPDGLVGQDIPLAARIILACDAYDAMTSERPYRPAMSATAAEEELRRHSGTQFCPTTVAALEAVLAGIPGRCSSLAHDSGHQRVDASRVANDRSRR